MEINEILIVAMFASFILLLFTGFPIAWVLGGVGTLFAALAYLSDMYLDTMIGIDFNSIGLVVSRIYKIMDNWILVALPMFIFMGNMLDKSGAAENLMQSFQELFGRVRGGLAITVILIGIILAASTGIVGASVVLLGVMSLPAMMKQGYCKTVAVGTVASAGTLGILIPPSIMLVIMADQLALSVGDLFMGAVIPGLLLGVLYIVYVLGWGVIRPESMPLAENVKPVTWRVWVNVLRSVLPTLLMIIAVLGSIFTGMATPTEASAVGAAAAIVLAWYNGRLSLKVVRECLHNTFSVSGYIFAIFIGATMFALVLRELGGDEYIESFLTSLPFGPYGIILFVLGIVFLLGFVLDWIEITLIVLPLVAPVVNALEISINGYGVIDQPVLVWFVMLVAVTLQTSFLTPPVGFALFYLKGVCPPEITLGTIYRGVIPFIVLQLIGLTLLILFPALVNWFPAMVYGQ
ncbi:TRAP transporter large permease [Thalassolituus sp. LLYu03]|uniref:TRAP transporter large permease n=1 Tax=Thalassolituus sp. LLYu03 TaxID=3421656 RepID=UPI003D275EA1